MSTLEDRHKTIVKLLRQEGGRFSVSALSRHLGVSAVTIRQDLRVLAQNNVIERVYGGAILRADGPLSAELVFEVRLQEARSEKEAIARQAALLIKEGYGIALDGSTSVYALVPHLRSLQNLTIVTNSLMVAGGFRDTPQNTVLMPGGRVRGDTATIVDTPHVLPELNLNYGFFGAWGVSADGGVSDVDPDEVQMRQALIRRCLKVIILIDSRKWGETAPFTFARLTQIDHVITSDLAPPEPVKQLRAMGITVDCVPVPTA